jgi:hypothetical protein
VSEETQNKMSDKEAWEAEQEQLRQEQNLPPGAVPEQRPQAFAQVDGANELTGNVQQRLRKEGSNMADNALAHGYEEYKRACSKAQMNKAERESKGPEILYPGAHCYINNPDGEGKEHHGRAVAVNRVAEFKTVGAESLANSGYNADRRFAPVETYEVSTRDGRAEILFVSAEHLQKVPVTEYHRTVT